MTIQLLRAKHSGVFTIVGIAPEIVRVVVPAGRRLTGGAGVLQNFCDIRRMELLADKSAIVGEILLRFG